MRPAAYRLAWAPPLLVGASAAIAAEVATGILLYAGPGLMRSLTTVLAVEGAALAVGLWSVPSRSGPRLVDRLRRRWLFCLLAFMGAAFFGTSWSVVQDLGGGPLGQGLGLAVLAALPLYASGLVLAGMNAVAADDPLERLRGPGAAAASGAALGFVLTGALLPRAPIPASLLVACLVLLSAGGMIYGVVLASRPVVHVRAARRSAGSEVRVEDRLRMSDGDATRYLLEGGYTRRYGSLEGNGAVPWDIVVARSVLGRREGGARILYVGGGASALPDALAAEHPDVHVDVLERNPAVVELARAHFGTAEHGMSAAEHGASAPGRSAPEHGASAAEHGASAPEHGMSAAEHGAPAPEHGMSAAEHGAPASEPGAPDRTRLLVGNLEDLLAGARGPYDLVLLDTAALAPLGGAEGLSRAARRALLAAVARDGVLAVGPSRVDPSLSGAAAGWPVSELRRPGGSGADEEEVVVLGRPGSAGPWTAPLGDFAPGDGGTPAP